MVLPWRAPITIILAALVLSLAGGSSVASAAPREVAYRCDLDICLLDPDNPSDLVNLSNNGNASFEEKPVWSPDGTHLAFISNLGGNGTKNIYVMNPTPGPGVDVNVARQVTHFSDFGLVDELAWSPDGSKIAFVRGTVESNRSISVAAADGTTGAPPLIAEHGEHPSWSPDGTKITYAYLKQIYTKDSDGTGFAAPLGSGVEPAWSPDGARIAFGFPAHPSEFLDLHIIPAGGGAPAIAESNTQFAFDSWSPDATRVAYRDTDENFGFFRVVNSNGSGDHPLAAPSMKNANGPAASWSPNTSRVVYQAFGSGVTDIYMSNTDGSGSAVPLTTDGKSFTPAWKPVPRSLPITPSGGGPVQPIPKTIVPKFFWIKTGIPWQPHQIQIIVALYGCDAPVCSVSTEGKAKAVAPSVRPRPFLAATSGKKKKPKAIVVAHGKMKVSGGKKKPLKVDLTKQGIAILEKSGHLKIELTVTSTAAGYKKRVDHHTVEVVRKAPAKKHKHAGH